MKSYRFIAVTLLVAIVAGCSKEFKEKNQAGQEFTITASFAENGTKTTLQDGGTAVYWEPSDEVKLFYDGTGSRFTAQCSKTSAVSAFTGSLYVAVGFGEGFDDSTPLWGLYPYRADATADNESVTTTLSAEQTGRAGSFAKSTFITLARSQSLKMGFYNVCGGVRFSLTRNDVKQVTFEGLNDEDLAGKVKLTFSGGVPVVSEVIEGEKSITLTALNSGCFEAGQWYYIVALPGTLSGGFKMTFSTGTQYATLKSTSSVTIKRGIFGSLTDADEDLVFKDNGGPKPGEGNIVFADVAAKYACVAKFDTNQDGEISYEEAAAATSFSGLFTDWKAVASFDEIQYFTRVTSLDGVFNGCTNLTSITVPENISDLGTYAFNGCSSLTSVVLPSGITAIGDNTFYGCSKLKSVDLPAGLQTVGRSAFCDCTSLAQVNLPGNISTMGDYVFAGCTALADIVIPDSVTSLGIYLFNGCTALVSAMLPQGITSVPAYCFENCSALESVEMPSSVTTIGDYAFDGVKMWSLELPATITTLGRSCFGNIVCVTVPSTSNVSIQYNTFFGQKAIFVPQDKIEMYKLMTNWKNYSLLLHPLTAFRQKDEFTLVTSGAVDMCLSVKWAACNLGASKPEEYGGYYQWAGTTDVTSTSIYLNCSNCPYHTGSDNNTGWTKYVITSQSSYWSGEGDPDNKTVLDLEDDAAHVALGGNWRMPTHEEWAELREHCYWESTSYNGENGSMVCSFESGNKIFLPVAGYRDGDGLDYADSIGFYWSSSLLTDRPHDAWGVSFLSVSVDWNIDDRYCGLSIRPVQE